jgi:hypothetical protein
MSELYLMGSDASLSPGRVGLARLPNIEGIGYININPYISSEANTAVITKFTLDQQVNSQFSKTLLNAVYAYSFGDMPSDAVVQGIAFPKLSSCQGSVDSVKAILEYYSENKMSANLEKITITFSEHVVEGYIVGCRVAAVDPNTYAYSFMLALKVSTVRSK